MSNLTKPPILDDTGQDILSALGAIKQNLPQGGGSNGYAPTDATEATLADDDKVPFYDTSASGKRNSTWANIKAKLKAYFDTIYGSVTGVKGDSESTYRTGNVNITSDNIGALSKNGGTISGNILPDNNYSYALGNYGHAFGAVSAASFYVDDSVNGGRSKVYFEGTSPLNSVKIPEGNGTIATENYIKELLKWKTAQTNLQWVNGTYNFISGVDISNSNEVMLILTYIGSQTTTKRQSYIFPTSALLDGSIFWDIQFTTARMYMGLSSNGTQITVANATTQSNSIRFDVLYR